MDVFAKGIRGKEAEKALDEAYITVNKNAIPFDVNPPLNPSGIRLGSPAVTTRGFREAEMREVGALIADVLHDLNSQETRRVGAPPGHQFGRAIPAVRMETGAGHRVISARHLMNVPPDCPRCAPRSRLRHRHVHSQSGSLARQDRSLQINTPWSPPCRTFRNSADLPANFETAVYQGKNRTGFAQLDIQHVPAKSRCGPFPYPLERGATVDAQAVPGDDPRYEHAAVCEPIGLSEQCPALLSCGAACFAPTV